MSPSPPENRKGKGGRPSRRPRQHYPVASLAEYRSAVHIQDIPHDKYGPTVVEISCNYDHSGTVDVSARTKNGHVDLPVIIKDLESDVPARFPLPPEPLVSEHVMVYLSFDLSGVKEVLKG